MCTEKIGWASIVCILVREGHRDMQQIAAESSLCLLGMTGQSGVDGSYGATHGNTYLIQDFPNTLYMRGYPPAMICRVIIGTSAYCDAIC